MYDDFKVANYPNSLVSPELYARHESRLWIGDVVDGLTVTPGTGLQVVLAPGNAFIRYGSTNVASARYMSLVNNFSLAIGTPDASNPRIDLVVVYIDNGVELPDTDPPTSANLDGKGVAKAKIVEGSAAATPSAPNDTAIQASVGAGNPYTVVAQVRVDSGVSVIAENKITDAREMAKLKADKIDSATYSTIEKVVGTTDDGRTIYERVFNGVITAAMMTRAVTVVTANLTVTQIISWSGYFNASTRQYPLGTTWGTSNGADLTVSSGMWYEGTTVTLVTLTDLARTNAPYKLILRYTKN